jgi:alkaline phosphatase D
MLAGCRRRAGRPVNAARRIIDGRSVLPPTPPGVHCRLAIVSRRSPGSGNLAQVTLDRRTFLKAGAVVGAAAAVPLQPVRALADATADPALAPFLHGVASGDPLVDRVVLWTRVTTDQPGDVAVRWVLAQDPALTRVVASGTTTAPVGRDRTVKVDPVGLAPATTYYYAFEALGRRSMVGRTRTAPAGAVDRLRFAVASCAKYDQGFFNAYARIAEADVDAVLHLGDYIYEEANKDDAPGERFIDPRTEIYSVEEYRRRHAQYRLDPDLQRVHQQHPFVVTWDDHESANNAWFDGANRHDPAVHGPFAVRKAAAQWVWDEWMPVRLPDPADPTVIYRALGYGDLATLVVIDTRLEGRSEQLPGRANAGEIFSTDPAAADPARQMYSPTQRTFIEQALGGSGAAWKLVLNQVLVSQLKLQNVPQDVSLALASLGQTGIPTEGVNLATDIWDGYEAERNRLLGFLRDNEVDDVVVLTGDIHTSWANDLTEDPFDVLTPPAAVELVATSVTSGNFDEIFGAPPRTTSLALEQTIRTQNPSTKYVELDSNGWLLLDLTPDRLQGEYLFVDTVTEPSAGQVFAASWQVLRGANRLSTGGPQTAARATLPADAPPPQVVPVGGPAAGTQPPSPPPPSAAGDPVGRRLPATGPAGTVGAGLSLAALAAVLRRAGRDSGNGQDRDGDGDGQPA